MANQFSAKLNITQVDPVVGDGTSFDIVATVIDNTGVFTAASVTAGDMIYDNGMTANNGIGRYAITNIASAVGSVLTARVTWALSTAINTLRAPLVSNDALIGKTINSITNLPSYAVQLLPEKFLSECRNIELQLTAGTAGMGYFERVTIIPGVAAQTVLNQYVPGSEKIFYNGLLQVHPDDYTRTDVQEFTFVNIPTANDVILVFYTRV